MAEYENNCSVEHYLQYREWIGQLGSRVSNVNDLKAKAFRSRRLNSGHKYRSHLRGFGQLGELLRSFDKIQLSKMTEVKQYRGLLVLGWETAWEHRVGAIDSFF